MELEQRMRDGPHCPVFEASALFSMAPCVDFTVVAVVCVVAEAAPHEGMRKAQTVWSIFRIHHQRRCVAATLVLPPAVTSMCVVLGICCSRYLFEQYYFEKSISKELYEWCLREVRGLRWNRLLRLCLMLPAACSGVRRRKFNRQVEKGMLFVCFMDWLFWSLTDQVVAQPGYERLCCLRCIQSKDHNFMTTCICRVRAANAVCFLNLCNPSCVLLFQNTCLGPACSYHKRET